MGDKATSNAMWGGRFAGGPDAVMEAINASIDFDRRLAAEDVEASRAHAAMLGATGIVSDSDATAIREGLLTVLSEIEAGDFAFSKALEDIHMNVESRLKEVIGEPAGRLHTARSRNDQVATDFRLWVRGQCDAAVEGLTALMRALVAQAERRRRAGDAGVHASAGGAAGDLGAPHARLRRDARPRPRAVPRRAGADEREPARGGGAGGDELSDRPGDDGGGARVRAADGELARRGQRPGLRAGVPRARRRSARCICRASPRSW